VRSLSVWLCRLQVAGRTRKGESIPRAIIYLESRATSDFSLLVAKWRVTDPNKPCGVFQGFIWDSPSLLGSVFETARPSATGRMNFPLLAESVVQA
jgi:hypothetical protein